MRQWWIVIVTVIFIVGLVAGFLVGKFGNPESKARAGGSSDVARGPGSSSQNPGGPGEGPIRDAPQPASRGTVHAAGNTAYRGYRLDSSPASGGDGAALAGGQPGAGSGGDMPNRMMATGGEASTVGMRGTGIVTGTSGGVAGAPGAASGASAGAAGGPGRAPGGSIDPAAGIRSGTTPAQSNPTSDPSQTPTGDKVPVPIDPESDRRAPALDYLRFDPPEILDGNATTLTVGASDDLSGVKSVYGYMRNPSEKALLSFSAQDSGSGAFTTQIMIPRQAETGAWFVAYLQIVDKADNPLIAQFTKTTVPQGGTLSVSSRDSDSAPPDVRRVWLDKATVSGGQKNLVIVDIGDDRSGVASVTGKFQSPTGAAISEFSCHGDANSGFWEGDLSIPENADCGYWTLQQLRVVDNANNVAYLMAGSPQIERVGFAVSGGGDCDSTPPTVDSLSMTPDSVSSDTANEIVMSMIVHDDSSGAASCLGRLDGPPSSSGQPPRIFFNCAPPSRDPNAPMTAKIALSQYAAKGTWKVNWMQVLDKARNTATFQNDDPVLRNATLQVQ